MKESVHHSPKWLDKFLEWFCDEALLEEIQGDLHEAYHHRVQTSGQARANQLFAIDVFRFFKPYAFEKYSHAKQFLPMFDNYFKVALRNILHRRRFTAINLLGLTIGVSAVLLIGMYLNHELSYDASTPDQDRMYRLMNHYRDQIYTPMFFQDYHQSPQETQMRLINHISQYEEVQVACHFVPSQSAIGGGEKYVVEVDEKKIIASNVLFTNTGLAFQAIFPQTFLQGSPEASFSGFGKIVLTERSATRWFGQQWRKKNVIGKTVRVGEEVYEIAGVIEDVSENTHYSFNWIIHQREIPVGQPIPMSSYIQNRLSRRC